MQQFAFALTLHWLPCYNSSDKALTWWNGRHRGLKIPCRKACGFESRHQHALKAPDRVRPGLFAFSSEKLAQALDR